MVAGFAGEPAALGRAARERPGRARSRRGRVRFGIDHLGSGAVDGVSRAVAAAWEALTRGSWSEALDLLGPPGDDPEALEAAGVAHWWLDDADATIDARERAYRLYRERG